VTGKRKRVACATQEHVEGSAAGGSLKGKVAIVTGSTGGIGWGIAQCLTAEGADVLVNGFSDVLAQTEASLHVPDHVPNMSL
jgi:hypothetical protein